MGKIGQFYSDVKSEIKKVVYPKRDELIGSTWVVIITVIVISIYLGAVDTALSKLVAHLLKR